MISDGTASDVNSRENTQENSAEAESQPRLDDVKIADKAILVATPSKLVITDLGRATVKGLFCWNIRLSFR